MSQGFFMIILFLIIEALAWSQISFTNRVKRLKLV